MISLLSAILFVEAAQSAAAFTNASSEAVYFGSHYKGCAKKPQLLQIGYVVVMGILKGTCRNRNVYGYILILYKYIAERQVLIYHKMFWFAYL